MSTRNWKLFLSMFLLSMLVTALVVATPLQPQADEGEVASVSFIRAVAVVPEHSARAAGIVGEHSRRFSEVVLDLDALMAVSHSQPKGSRTLPNSQARIEIEPFPGERYNVRGKYLEQWTDSVWSWVGTIEGYDHAEVVFTITDRSFYGVLRAGPIVYEIRSGTDGRVYVREPDYLAYELESACALDLGDESRHELMLFGESESSSEDSDLYSSESFTLQSTPVLDLLLLYSSAAASRYDIEALANNSVASMNTSFINSNVDSVVRIVHYAEVDNYQEASTMNVTEVSKVTVDMAQGDGDFSGIPGLRNDHAADLAMMLWDGSKMGNTCGAAYIVGSSGDSSKFSGNTGDECIAMFNNFAHEIGHNLGGHHDYPDGDGINAYDYSHGYTHVDPDFRTIMGSGNSCSVNGCDRLNRWSDPTSQHSGEDMGVTDEADMVKSNNQMASVIAGYKAPSDPAPGSISTVTVTRGTCFGNNWVDWSTPSGLVGWYEVQTSTNSSYSNPQLIYRGSTESIHLEVSTETWVRVRACNGTGCSSWTNGNQTATYYPGCA